MARIISVLFLLLGLLNLCLTAKLPEVDYDVMVIGGGPAGLSAVSAFCRVARKVIMFDHEVYRNAPTRHMHDVIGNDGMYSSRVGKSGLRRLIFFKARALPSFGL